MTLTRTLMLALLAAVAVLAALPGAFADEETAASSKDKWAEHRGDLPFVVGYEKGMAEVKLTGRPPMYFFTATW